MYLGRNTPLVWRNRPYAIGKMDNIAVETWISNYLKSKYTSINSKKKKRDVQAYKIRETEGRKRKPTESKE